MRIALTLVILGLAAEIAPAQTPLTLDEAVGLARRNNAVYRRAVNGRRQADGQVRVAYAQLLPSVFASASALYQNAGEQFIQGVQLANSADILNANYGISVNYSINSAILFAPRAISANRDAAEADVELGGEFLRASVTGDYLNVLQAQALAALQDTLLQTTKGQLDLAKARQAVGATTIIDVRSAEVNYGTAEIASLRAKNTAEVLMLRLYERLGVAQPAGVTLTTRFPVAAVPFRLDSLLQLARTLSPAMTAVRKREQAASLGVKAQMGQYAPTLSLGTGWGGNASKFTDSRFPFVQDSLRQVSSLRGCLQQDSIRVAVGFSSYNCNTILAYDPQNSLDAMTRNSDFPFRKAPMSFRATLSMPIFNNLQREQQLQNAMIDRDNARFDLKARELNITAEVTQAYLNLATAVKTTELQEINASRAREELSLNEERYRVGAATFLEVTTSRGRFEQAQIDRLNAIYDYHRLFAVLESAVGRPLR